MNNLKVIMIMGRKEYPDSQATTEEKIKILPHHHHSCEGCPGYSCYYRPLRSSRIAKNYHLASPFRFNCFHLSYSNKGCWKMKKKARNSRTSKVYKVPHVL
jgi:hypothetical protein